jgi:signal transduction histidine kinase
MYKLFKRAYEDDEYERSGLGLPIVKKIVQNFDGEIIVKSEVGNGTTFTILVPDPVNI